MDRCAAVAHLHYVMEYQPESHFWMLQGVEAAIYVGLTLILAAVTVIAIRGGGLSHRCRRHDRL